ncbi:MFS_1 like family protein [Bradyrhizobium sp. Gha]|nr:MFS_1 like family protein [Bradyrhizobium sp. Gha]
MLADRFGSLRLVLAGCAALAAAAAVALLWVDKFWFLLVVALFQAAALAPTTSIADALSVNTARPQFAGRPFEYGWIRGSASAAFVLWSDADISTSAISFLRSEAVVAEVLVLMLAGPPLVDRVGLRGAALLAAAAGIVRWSVAGVTTSVLLLSLIQPLHGVTFALLHLACMRMMGTLVAVSVAATAQSLYAFCSGVLTAVLTFLSGEPRTVTVQPRSRLRLNIKPVGVNLLATSSARFSQHSSAIFWESITSPTGRLPRGMKHRPRVGRPFSSISQTFVEAPA